MVKCCYIVIWDVVERLLSWSTSLSKMCPLCDQQGKISVLTVNDPNEWTHFDFSDPMEAPPPQTSDFYLIYC